MSDYRHYPGASEFGVNPCDWFDSRYSVDAQGSIDVTHVDGTRVVKAAGLRIRVARPPARSVIRDWEDYRESSIEGEWKDLDDGAIVRFFNYDDAGISVTIYGDFTGPDGSVSDITIGSYYPSISGGKLYFWFFTLHSTVYGWADLNLSIDGTQLTGYYQYGHGEPRPWRMARGEQPWGNTPGMGRKAKPVDDGPVSISEPDHYR